jgi:hypothetical protein
MRRATRRHRAGIDVAASLRLMIGSLMSGCTQIQKNSAAAKPRRQMFRFNSMAMPPQA